MAKGFTAKQIKVLRQAQRRWNILYGATRSGKTYVSYFLIPRRIKEHYGDNVLLVGKTINTLDRNVFDPMRKLYGDDDIGRMVDKREITLWGKKCYCVGANDDRAITKIQGMGLGYAYLDEVTTYPENFFAMLKSRLDMANSRCDATCNPECPSHFIKKFIDDDKLDLYAEHFSIYDNTFLSHEFITNLENEYRGTVYFDKWILGKWVRSEGLVYPLFRREKHFMTPKAFEASHGKRLIKYVIWGVDGATTNDSTAIIPLAILDNGQAVVQEIFYHNPKVNGQMSNEQLLPYIKRYLGDMEDKYKYKRNRVTHYMPVDCAAADLVITLRSNLAAEYNVYKYSKKDIRQTTDVVNNALGRNVITVLDYGNYYNYVRGEYASTAKSDHPLVVDLESMVWDESNAKYDSEVPNDCADAFRYAVCAYYANPENLWETPEANAYYKLEEEVNE